jgi:hemoglobin-like flavoprotein
MSPEREQLIRESWVALQPRGAALARSFYAHLFELDPRLARLFTASNVEQQHVDLMAMLAEIVAVIDDPQRLVSEVAASGRRHVGFGAAERDCDLMGAALLRAMEHELGEAFTPELKGSWREAFVLVAAVMRRAAERR